MDRFRLKTSRSSDRQLPAQILDSNEGRRQAQKKGSLSKLTADSSCCTIPTTSGEELFSLDLGIPNSQRVSGMPMKKLLADELLKEGAVKKRSLGIVARLMGLEGLPVPQPVHNMRKGNTNGPQSSGKPKSDLSFKDSHHQRRKSMDHEEFKDVYEVVETVSHEAHRRQNQRTERMKCSPAEMEFIREKFMDVKRLSTNEKFRNSKEFSEALDILDSNKDLLLKFLEEPNSLFSKHFGDTGSCLPKQNSTLMKSLNRTKIERSMARTSADVQRIKNCERRSLGTQDDSPPLPHAHSFRCDSSGSRKSRVRAEQKDEKTHVSPRRIVILKPSTDNSQNVTMTSSRSFSGDRGRRIRSPGARYMEMDMLEREGLSKDSCIPGCRVKGSREIAREITRKMRTDIINAGGSSPAYIRGYVVEDSPCNISDGVSEAESDTATTVMEGRRSFDFQSQHQLFSGHSTMMSISPESKRRLSEMWRMTHTFHETRKLERISTLGEMLATSEAKIQPVNCDESIKKESVSGDKGETSRSRQKYPYSYGSKFTEHSSSTAYEVYKGSFKSESMGEQRYLMKNANKGRFNEDLKVGDREKVFHQGTISGGNKIQHSVNLNKQKCGTMVGSGGRNPSSGSPDHNRFGDEGRVPIKHTQSAINVDSPTPENLKISSGFTEEVLKTPSIKMVEPSSTELLEGAEISPHCPSHVPEPESPASVKEADQPSPISTLETPFVEDLSSGSECFGKVSAELEGLRMQLHLLKLESEEYAEGSIIVSTDEEEEEVSEENVIPVSQEDWRSSYMADILNMVEWDEPYLTPSNPSEQPLALSEYEKLENKYQLRGGQGSWCERKMLFDHLNHMLMENRATAGDPHPWVGGRKRRCGDESKKTVEDELRRLVWGGGGRGGDGGVVSLEEWMSLGEDMDMVGGEVCRMLIDELVIEVVAELA